MSAILAKRDGKLGIAYDGLVKTVRCGTVVDVCLSMIRANVPNIPFKMRSRAMQQGGNVWSVWRECEH